MGFEFAEVVAKLGEGVAVRGKLVSREDGLVGFGGNASRRVGCRDGGGFP